jgi:hypothetical protein
MKFRAAWIRRLACSAACGLLVAGCAGPRAAAPSPAGAAEPIAHDRYGRVVRVNDPGGYVVLECTFLPSVGEEITVFRDRERRIRSRVRVGSIASGHSVVADILEGHPMPGDWFIGR